MGRKNKRKPHTPTPMSEDMLRATLERSRSGAYGVHSDQANPAHDGAIHTNRTSTRQAVRQAAIKDQEG